MSHSSEQVPPPQTGTILPKLRIPRADAYEKLNVHVQNGVVLLTSPLAKSDIYLAFEDSETWREHATRLLAFCFEGSATADAFSECTRRTFIFHSGTPLDTKISSYNELMRSRIRALSSILRSLDLYEENISIVPKEVVSVSKKPQELALEKLEQIANRFHVAARQLRQRHADRDTLVISDEYDVQDLFHAFLRLSFDDIRDEEWTPSYAGGASRIDFLLKAEQVVIEIKMTRMGLARGKDVSDQLIIDSDRYQAHPDCKMLVAFVYDPQEYLNNPSGIERDLTKTINGVPVKVIIRSR